MSEQASGASAVDAPATTPKKPIKYVILKSVPAAEGGEAWQAIWETEASSVDQVVALLQADGSPEGEHAIVPVSYFHLRRLGEKPQPPEKFAEKLERSSLLGLAAYPNADLPGLPLEEEARDVRPVSEAWDPGEQV